LGLYKENISIRYSKYNLSWPLLNRLRWDGTKIKSIIGSLAKTMHVSKSTLSTLYFPFLLYCIKNKKIDLEFDESLEEIVEKEIALIKWGEKRMPSCRICNKPLIWKKPYKKGDRPVEKDGSIHDCSRKKENEDLKCIICGGSVGCPNCEFIEDCSPQSVSPFCICKKCEQLEDPFISYKKAVSEKFPMLNIKIWPELDNFVIMHSDKIDEFLKKRKTADQGGGQDRISKQHEKGKLTARERVNLLLDEGSFVEVDALTTHHYHEYDMQKKKFFGDGIIGGYGMINGRQVYIFAYDFTVLGGTLSKMGAKKFT